MEKRQNEDPDLLEQSLATAAAESGNESGGENESVRNAPDVGEAAAGDGNESESGENTDTDNSADPADPAPDSGSQPAGGSEGTGSGDNPSGDGGDGGDGDGGGNGSPGADEEPSGEGPDKSDPSDNPDDPDNKRFEERFLNSGAADGTEMAGKRERLAVSLLRMALSLLNGEMPEDRFVSLMDATLAHEAVADARAEGEIAGRNAVIEERLVTPPAGAPDLGGTPIARSRRRAASIFDLADLAR